MDDAHQSPPAACLIGVTGFGAVHLRDLIGEHDAGRMRFVAATVINPEACPEALAELASRGVAVYGDYRAMLAAWRGRADWCFIPTAIHAHRAMTEDALASGMHVFVEKPAAATVQEVRSMAAAERASGRMVAVGFQSMYSGAMLEAKEALASGAVGTVEMVKFYGLWYRGADYYARNDWVARLRVGDAWVLDSPLQNAFAHYLMLPLFLAGEEARSTAFPVRVAAEWYRARSIASADTVALRVTTRSGVPVMGWLTHANDGPRDDGPVIEVRGTRGRFRWTMRDMVLESSGGAARTWRGDFHPERTPPLREELMGRLLARARGDTEAFVCGLDASLAHTATVNAAHDAADILDFPSELRTTMESGSSGGDNPRPVIEGLAALIHRAYAEERLFSEMGVAWARGGEADASAYMEGTADFPQAPRLRALAHGERAK